MKTRILAIILSVCLVGALAWGFTNYKEVGELKQAEMQLRMEMAEQMEAADHWESEWAWQRDRAFAYEDEIVRLEGELEYLDKELDEGLVIIQDLIREQEMSRVEYDLISENLEQRETAYQALQESLEKWKTAYNDLQANYNQLTDQMEDVDYLQYLLQLLL